MTQPNRNAIGTFFCVIWIIIVMLTLFPIAVLCDLLGKVILWMDGKPYAFVNWFGKWLLKVAKAGPTLDKGDRF